MCTLVLLAVASSGLANVPRMMNYQGRLTDGSGKPTAGVRVAAGGGSWSSISDRNLKENIRPIDTREILQKVAKLSINTWNYKAQDESIRHIGPTAQDFYSAFGVGEDNRYISSIDADGVALAAIKALHEKTEKIDKLEAEVARLRAMVEKLLADHAPAAGADELVLNK
jgi:hypothetical protein